MVVTCYNIHSVGSTNKKPRQRITCTTDKYLLRKHRHMIACVAFHLSNPCIIMLSVHFLFSNERGQFKYRV